ncbi:unnamed protein product [Brachionus calyciflorus]|uniref:W2 domain-containing protein n=1 Tax=Brachionus calyciflorus TaxID=104777 RepID=A0A813PRK0_9BILA|nr:unnamed protein product [Brachionus calyciflorus]
MSKREANETTEQKTCSFDSKVEQIENRLNELFKSSVENKDIFDKIESEYDPPKCDSKEFIRALVISLCNSCYIDNKFDADLFKKRVPILKKFIANKKDHELESLFAIQALDYRFNHQPGFIRIIFDLIYDEDIVCEDVFQAWRAEDREKDHGICTNSLRTFFDWLDVPYNDSN